MPGVAAPKRLAALVAALLIAFVAASAQADDLPGAFGGHGVAFSYPETWLHVPAQFQVQTGAVLWQEFFGPNQAPPPADPNQPPPTTPTLTRDLVAVAAYQTNVAITKKTLPRYKPMIQRTIAVLTAQAGGQILSGPQRVTMGGLPGYRFEITANLDPGTTLESRLVLVFQKKTEYFLNCQHVQGGPLTSEIESGCDLLMQTFRVSR